MCVCLFACLFCFVLGVGVFGVFIYLFIVCLFIFSFVWVGERALRHKKHMLYSAEDTFESLNYMENNRHTNY